MSIAKVLNVILFPMKALMFFMVLPAIGFLHERYEPKIKRIISSILIFLFLSIPAGAQYYQFQRQEPQPDTRAQEEWYYHRYQQQVQENWYQQQLYEQQMKRLRDELEIQQQMMDNRYK